MSPTQGTSIAEEPFLVAPVGRDSRFGQPMHLLGADLDLERLAVGSDHRGVEALIEVDLGHGDEVLEAAGDRHPLRMDQAEGGVAIAEVGGDDPDPDQVEDLLEAPLALRPSSDRSRSGASGVR